MDVDHKKDVLIFGKGPTQKLDHTTVTDYSINFTKKEILF